jgi:hypothetical protein
MRGFSILVCSYNFYADLRIPLRRGRRQVSITPGHLKGIVIGKLEPSSLHAGKVQPGTLERPLSVYEEAVMV